LNLDQTIAQRKAKSKVSHPVCSDSYMYILHVLCVHCSKVCYNFHRYNDFQNGGCPLCWIFSDSIVPTSWFSLSLYCPNLLFYPRDAMLARVFARATCPSVCPFVRHAPLLCQNEES